MTTRGRPGERALLAELLLRDEATHALEAMGEEERARLLERHKNEGHAELGSYLIVREWFDEVGGKEACEKALEMMIMVQTRQHGQTHELVTCTSLEGIIDEIRGRLNTPFIPEDARFWVCPSGSLASGTFVAVLEGRAVCMATEKPTLKDVRLRILDPNLAYRHGKRDLREITAEFGSTHAFTTPYPPREREGDSPNVTSVQIVFDTVPDDCCYTPTPDHKVYALIRTGGAHTH